MMNVMNYQDYDVILNVFDALEKEKLDVAHECLDGNFRSTVLNEEVSREEYLEIYRRIKTGMPDVKFKIVDLTTDGESFKANIKIAGTHSHTIPSLKKGWRKMLPTGNKINKVVSSVEFRVRSERILEIRNLDAHKGVISGLLDELHLLPKNYSCN